MTIISVNRAALLSLAIIVATATGCVDDNDNPVDPVLDAAFLGYSNPATRQTTCGNCHIGKQRGWAATGHARAWSGLQNSGHATAACYACHTTSGFGNLAEDNTGFFGVAADARRFYYDVQCESCHGPGGGHVSAPDDAVPLSTIFADTATTIGCGTCHTGTHTPFVEEWRASGHGNLRSGTPTTNVSCTGCHEGRAALARFDPGARYLEQGGTSSQRLTCAVCHDPHGSSNPANLRLSATTPSLETNLCMQCHMRRFAPDPTSAQGPHSPQGPMILGDAGWTPPNFQYDVVRQASSHGVNGNPGLCATCHLESFTVNDAATGQFLVNATGHSFKAIPCVDANGRPTGAATCPDNERRFNSCVSVGCHTSAANALGLLTLVEGRLMGYVNTLWQDLNGNGRLDAAPADGGLLATVRLNSPDDFSTTGAGASVITVGEGAWFNASLIRDADGSRGVHNPFYAEALMLSSEAAVRATYTYLPPAPPAQQARNLERMRALGMIR
jgi:predicted CXXCH cytochrome family protein